MPKIIMADNEEITENCGVRSLSTSTELSACEILYIIRYKKNYLTKTQLYENESSTFWNEKISYYFYFF